MYGCVSLFTVSLTAVAEKATKKGHVDKFQMQLATAWKKTLIFRISEKFKLAPDGKKDISTAFYLFFFYTLISIV